jgi:hypothetical protein
MVFNIVKYYFDYLIILLFECNIFMWNGHTCTINEILKVVSWSDNLQFLEIVVSKHEMKKAELEYKKYMDRALVIHRRNI